MALFGAVLPATTFYNSVHVNLQEEPASVHDAGIHQNNLFNRLGLRRGWSTCVARIRIIRWLAVDVKIWSSESRKPSHSPVIGPPNGVVRHGAFCYTADYSRRRVG